MSGIIIGQGSTVQMKVLEDLAINIDGEPEFKKAPFYVDISYWGEVPVLVHPRLAHSQQQQEEEEGRRSEKRWRDLMKAEGERRRREVALAQEEATNERGKWYVEVLNFLLYSITGTH